MSFALSQQRCLVSCLVVILLAGMIGCKKPDSNVAKNGENAVQEEGDTEEGNSVGNWASDNWNRAVEGGSNSVDNSQEWLAKMYRSAKDQGTTTAGSMKEWVISDWQAQGDWQYQVLTINKHDVAALQSRLNEAGKQRWECFQVDTSSEDWIFFMKRSRRSYLSNLSLKDLGKILPNGDSE